MASVPDPTAGPKILDEKENGAAVVDGDTSTLSTPKKEEEGRSSGETTVIIPDEDEEEKKKKKEEEDKAGFNNYWVWNFHVIFYLYSERHQGKKKGKKTTGIDTNADSIG